MVEELRFVSRLPAPAADVFTWHERPGALERLTPPWERLAVVSRRGTIRDGDEIVVKVKVGPFPRRWVARHSGYERGHAFRDEQVQGPFKRWVHHHTITPAEDGQSLMEDRIELELPLGGFGRGVAGGAVKRRIGRTFAYRHATLAADLERHAGVTPRRIAITGSSGVVGRALSAFLTTGGHEVVHIVRRPVVGPGEVAWDPVAGSIDPAGLEGLDAIVHLAGENVGARWTKARKQRILHSRILGTQLLCETIAGLSRPPRVLVSASAVGIYGVAYGEEALTEEALAGSGFLADVCRGWEGAAEPARAAGVRVVHPRLGVVLTPAGGALARMLPAFRMAMGGRIGSGQQVMSWVAIDDVLYAILKMIVDEHLVGPVNVTAPGAVTQLELARAIGAAIRRPSFMPLPAGAVRLLFGEMGNEMLLGGARVLPAKLEMSGFDFSYPTIDLALAHLLGDRGGAGVASATDPVAFRRV